MEAADYRLWLRLENRGETDASFPTLVTELKNNHAGFLLHAVATLGYRREWDAL